MKKMLLILNPCSGTKKVNRYLTEIVDIFNRDGYEVTVFITAGKDDATREACRMAHQVDAIVCCGGDGTFNETVSGVLQSGANVPIGYIPGGSTNDFASSIGLSTNVMEAADTVADGAPISFDVGRFQDRYFCYVASFGAFTKVSYNTPQSVKNALGHTAYWLSGIQELSQIRDIHVKMELDDEVIEGDYLFGAVCNTTTVAGLVTLDPKQVDMSDGKFEILLVRAPKDLLEMTECIQAIQNKTYNCGMVSFRSASRIRITMDELVDWTLDGEWQPGAQNIEISNLHQAIRVFRKEGAK